MSPSHRTHTICWHGVNQDPDHIPLFMRPTEIEKMRRDVIGPLSLREAQKQSYNQKLSESYSASEIT